MKLTLPRAALVGILGRVARVVERRTTIPILANVLLRADADGLVVRATDLDIEMTERVAARVEQPGALTCPAHILGDIAKKLPEGDVTLEQREAMLIVRSGRSRFTLNTLPETDFPALATGELPIAFTLSGAELKRVVEAVEFAISTEETRYYLNGIYIHATDGDGGPVLRFVATDGHRLARAEILAPAGTEVMPGIILPRKAVLEIARLLGTDDVAIALSPAKAQFTFGEGVVLTTKLIDGTFPDYNRVIPHGNARRCGIDTAAFSAAIDRVGAIATEKGRAVRLTFAEGTLTAAVRHPDGGAADEDVDVEHEGSFEIGFNARYLLDICGRLPAKAELMLDTPGSPAILRASPEARDIFVLMPMRV